MDRTDKLWLMTQLYDMRHRPSNHEFHLMIPCPCLLSYYSHCPPPPPRPQPRHPPPSPPPPPPPTPINHHLTTNPIPIKHYGNNARESSGVGNPLVSLKLAYPPSQSDNALWNWAEWRVYASVNQIIIFFTFGARLFPEPMSAYFNWIPSNKD